MKPTLFRSVALALFFLSSVFSALASPGGTNANLLIAKSVDKPNPAVGDYVTFDISVTNLGPAVVSNMVVQESLPSGLSLSGYFNGFTNSFYDASSGLWYVTNLFPGSFAALEIYAEVNSMGAMTNVASIISSSPPNSNPSNNTASVALNVTSHADLSITKSGYPDPVVVGNLLTYTLYVYNAGPDDCTNVFVRDAIPPGTVFVDAIPSNSFTYYSNFLRVDFPIADLPAYNSTNFTVIVMATNVGEVINFANAFGDTFDPDTTNNTASATNQVVPPTADLSVTKSGYPAIVGVGGQITYTVYVYNNGPSDATNVVIRDAIPSGTVFVSASSASGTCTYYPNFLRVDCPIGIFQSGFSASMTVTVQATNTGSIINFANAFADTPDPNTTNNTASATNLAVSPQADLAITKSGYPYIPTVGNNITYSLSVYNSGPSDATNVVIRDAIPSGTVFVSASSPNGACTYYPNFLRVDCPIGILPSGYSASMTVTVQVTNAGPIINFANVFGDTPDPNTANNTASVTNQAVTPHADLYISKSAFGTATVGNNLTYSLYVYNYGPSDSTNVVIRDAIPSGTVFVSASSPNGACTYYPNFLRVDCPIGVLTSGSSASMSVTVQVTNAGPIINFANVFGDTPDPNTANNTTSVTNQATTPQADLSIFKSGSPNPVGPGQNITYSLYVYNNGPNTATNVVIRDAIPSGTVFVSASSPNGTPTYFTNFLRVDCPIGTLSAFSSASMTVVVQVTNAGPVINAANVFADTPDPNTTNNTAFATNTVRTPQADLQMFKYANSNSVAVGQNVVFTLSLQNNGPDNVTNQITVADAIPPGFQYVSDNSSLTGSSYSAGLGTWTLPNGVGNTATISMSITMLATNGGFSTNTAVVTTPAPYLDLNPSNNTASAIVSVTSSQADLRITKTASTNIVQVGQQLTFTLLLTNAGPSAVFSNTVINDLLPAGLQYVTNNSGLGNGSYNPALGQWMVIPGPAGGSVALTITAMATNAGTFTNTATIVVPPGYIDPNLGNNTNSAIVSAVLPSADLQITKTASTNLAQVGQQLTFTLLLSNAGPSAVFSNTVINDLLPPGLQYVTNNSGLGNGSYNPALGQWTVIPGPAGGSVALTITAVAMNAGTFTNTATIIVPPGYTDPNFGNNTSSAIVSAVLPSADLQITKTASTNLAQVGQQLTFTLLLTDAGPSAVFSNTVINDFLPAGLQYVTNNSGLGNGSYNPALGQWTVIPGPAGGSVALTLTAMATNAGTFTNTATIVVPPGYIDPNLGNNSAFAVVTVQAQQADIAVTKSVAQNNAAAGQPITCTITAQNLGPGSASNVVIQDFVPAGVTLVSSNVPAGTTFSTNNNQWTLASLSNGASNSLQLSFVSAVATNLTNTAAVISSSAADPNLANNTNSVAMTWQSTNVADVGVIVQLAITSRTNYNQGDEAVFRIWATNVGPSTASNIVIQVPVQTGYTSTFYTVDGFTDGSYNLTNQIWNVSGSLRPGFSTRMTLTVNILTNGQLNFCAYKTNSTPFDPNPTNDMACTTIWVQPRYNITGFINDCRTNGPPLTNIAVNLTGVTNIAAITDTNGFYQFNFLPAGNYTVTPAVTNYTLTPTNATVTLSNANVSVPPFVTTSRFISGVVRQIAASSNGPPLGGVIVQLTGPTTATNITDTNGNYIFTNLSAGTYTVAPLTNGFPGIVFMPTNAMLSLNVVGCTNCTNCAYTANFTSTNKVLVLRALEVVQVVQDWQNSVPLVAQKRTLVRAFLQLYGSNTTPARARGAQLRVINGGTQTVLMPENNPGGLAVTTNAVIKLNSAGGVISQTLDLRTNIDSSLNFELPEALRTGTNVQFRFEWTNGVLICASVCSNQTVSASFRTIPTIQVKWLFTKWTETDGTVHGPATAKGDELTSRLLSIYPVNRVDADTTRFEWTNNPPRNLTDTASAHLDTLLADLRALHDTDVRATPSKRLYYCVVTDIELGGLGYVPGDVSDGSLPASSFVYGRNRHAHEMGHSLGFRHAVYRASGGKLVGDCNETGPTNAPIFPFMTLQADGTKAPTLGPVLGTDDSSINQLAYGWDSYAANIVDPFLHFELMGYCGTWRWISTYTYTNTMNAVTNRFAGGGGGGGGGAARDYMMVRGLVELDNDALQLMPNFTINTSNPPPYTPGPYDVDVLDASNNLLEDIPFQPDEIHPDYPATDVPPMGSFDIAVPVVPGMAQVAIMHSGVQIGYVIAPAHAPTVQLLSPIGGEIYSNNPINVSWTASDLDGNPLTFLVQYSGDGGTNWATLATDWPNTSLQVDSSLMAATTQGLMRVTASDGFHSTAAQSPGMFTILNHAPTITIYNPTNNEIFIGSQQLALQANAEDLEDGVLDGTNVVWTTSLGAQLGTGAEVFTTADQLPAGTNTIIATAYDSSGATTSSSVTIFISRLDLPILTIAPNGSQVTLTWPGTLTNYVLEATSSIAPTSWSAVPSAPALDDLDDWSVTVDAGATTQFFRLHQGP